MLNRLGSGLMLLPAVYLSTGMLTSRLGLPIMLPELLVGSLTELATLLACCIVLIYSNGVF